MFEVDVVEEDQLRFGVLIHSCIVHNDFSLPVLSTEILDLKPFSMSC